MSSVLPSVRPASLPALLVARPPAPVSLLAACSGGSPTRRPDGCRARDPGAGDRAREGRSAGARRAAALAPDGRHARPTSPSAPRSRSRSRTRARPARRPASTQADNVWEEVVEGGISRFVAVYHSQVPGRGRTDPLGASDGPGDRRADARPHRVLRRPGGLRAGAEGRRACRPSAWTPVPPGSTARRASRRRRTTSTARRRRSGTRPTASHSAARPRSSSSPSTAEQATRGRLGRRRPATVAVKLSRLAKPTWTWDAGTGTYLRSEGATPAIGALGRPARGDERRHAHGPAGELGHGRPGRQPGARDRARRLGRRARCPRGGKTVPVTWTKTGEDAVLTLADGGRRASLTLAPGTTWIELVPRAPVRSRSADTACAPRLGAASAWQPGCMRHGGERGSDDDDDGRDEAVARRAGALLALAWRCSSPPQPEHAGTGDPTPPVTARADDRPRQGRGARARRAAPSGR